MTRFDNFEGWFDLTSETWREYVTADGKVYRIDSPQKFFVNKTSGTHYVLDSKGIVHTLLASAFMVLRFDDKDGITFVGTQN